MSLHLDRSYMEYTLNGSLRCIPVIVYYKQTDCMLIYATDMCFRRTFLAGLDTPQMESPAERKLAEALESATAKRAHQ